MPKLQYLAAQPSGRRFPPVQTLGLFRADCPDKDKLPPFCATSLHSNSCAATPRATCSLQVGCAYLMDHRRFLFR